MMSIWLRYSGHSRRRDTLHQHKIHRSVDDHIELELAMSPVTDLTHLSMVIRLCD